MSDLYLLGLTGSIGMGKTTTANMFRDAEIAVWDADAAVHELYTTDTDTIEKIYDLAPAAVGAEGVNRQALGNILQADRDLFPKLEAIVHPAIREHRAAFIEACKKTNQTIAVLDIPLLYETNAQDWLDGVLVVTIDSETQSNRVMARKGMNKESFEMILSRQMPDAEKRKKADFVIETKSLDHVKKEVDKLIKQISGQIGNA